MNDPDLEVSQSARFVLQEIDKDKAAPLSPVAARVVALRKPPGAAEVLLAYLPFCDDEGLLTEVQAALNAVAYPDGKPGAGPGQGAGGQGRLPAAAPPPRPSASAPSATTSPAVKKLLKDDQARGAAAGGPGPGRRPPRPRRRARADCLIGEPNGDQSGQAEEYLLRLAADHGPLDLPTGRRRPRQRAATCGPPGGRTTASAWPWWTATRRPPSSATSATPCSSSRTTTRSSSWAPTARSASS